MMSNIQNMRILLIGDNPTLVNAFTKFLRIKGFFVTTESSLKASLRRLKKELYDVVFVDAPLEDYDEVQILLHLKENKIFQKTNVLLFSYLDFDSAELNKWKNHGLYSYLKKPVKRNVIIKTLDDLRFKTNSESQFISEFEPKEEEATPEQLDKLKQLEKQIQELESQPKSTQKLVVQSELNEKKATPEQLDKLKQLGKQIQKLENIRYHPMHDEKDPTPKNLSYIKQDSFESISDFQKIIHDLSSLSSSFDSVRSDFTTNIKTAQDIEIIKNEMIKTSSEISKLKKEIEYVEELTV